MWRVILSLALGLLSPPCAHGIKHTRRIAFKTQQDYKYQRAIQSPVPFLNTTLPVRCGPYRPPLAETSPVLVSTSWDACVLQNLELVLKPPSFSVILWAAMKGLTSCALCCLTTTSFPHAAAVLRCGCSNQGSQVAHKQLTSCLAIPSSLVPSHSYGVRPVWDFRECVGQKTRNLIIVVSWASIGSRQNDCDT